MTSQRLVLSISEIVETSVVYPLIYLKMVHKSIWKKITTVMYLLSGIAEVYCCIASDSESDVGNSQPIKIINIVE